MIGKDAVWFLYQTCVRELSVVLISGKDRERGREKEKQRERDKLHLEGLNSTLPGTPQAQEEIFGFEDIRDFWRKWPFRIPSHEVVSSKAWAAYTVFKEQCEEVTNSYLTVKVNSQQSQDQR